MTLNINRYALTLSALLVAGGTTTACGQKDAATPPTPTAPAVMESSAAVIAPSAAVTPPAATASGLVTGGERDGSLPDTAAALATPGVAPAANARPPSTMTPEQESKAMPLPGQANDHSTPARAKPKGS